MTLIVKCKALLEKQTEECRLPGVLRKIVSLLSHKETCKKEAMPLLVSLIVKMFFLPGGAEISFLVTSRYTGLCPNRTNIFLFNNHLAGIWHCLPGLIFVLDTKRHGIISTTGF